MGATKTVTTTVVVTLAIVGGVLLIKHAAIDPPIDVVDGTIHFNYGGNFDRVLPNEIKAATLMKHAKTIQVWDQFGVTLYETINVQNRHWTMSSADGSVTVSGLPGSLKDQVPIASPAGSTIVQNTPGDFERFHYVTQSKFTPATLTFTGGQPLPPCATPVPATNSCTLSCPAPSGNCMVRIQYKF
jgi:hypothetical protein